MSTLVAIAYPDMATAEKVPERTNPVRNQGSPRVAYTSPRSEPTSWPGVPRAVGPRHHGSGWVLFAGLMICLVGMLDVIYGIAAIGDSRFFVGDATYILSGLNAWGWIMLALGVPVLVACRLHARHPRDLRPGGVRRGPPRRGVTR
jgi:hypothetical protein